MDLDGTNISNFPFQIQTSNFLLIQKNASRKLNDWGITRMLIPGPLRPWEIHGNSIHPKMVKFPWRRKQGMWEIELDPHEWWIL